MEAVGAAATIIGLVQTGLSLAKALNTYAGTVHDSNDDIAIIADDIYATYRHLNDLDLVLKKNEKAGILTDDALASAQKCIRQAEILIRKLKKLLVKGYGNDDAGAIIESTQIDVSKFKKGIWYIYKSEFELRRSELARIKADISLIYLTYLALSANTTTERKQAQDEMELVYNRKIVLSRYVQKARERRDRDAEEGVVDEAENEDGETEHDDVYEIPAELEHTAIVYDNVEALYREFENWLAQKEQKAEALAAERKVLEDEAIARHENELKKKATKVQTETQKLRDILLHHGVPPQRVLEITKDIFPGSVETSAGDKDVVPGASTTTGKADSGSLLDPLRDLDEPGGIAQLKAFYLQRVHTSPTRSEIMKLEVAVSGQQLLQKRGTDNKSGKFSGLDTHQGLGSIPEDYVLQIKQELETLQSDTSQAWILLHAEPVKKRSDNGRSRFSGRKKTKEEVVGVQIVIRKVSGMAPWQAGAEKTTETISVQARPSSPETVTAPRFMASNRISRAAGREYYPQHASQIITRPGTTTTNYKANSVRIQAPSQRGRRFYNRSADSSPERDVAERQTRFASEVTTIPSPRYDNSMSDIDRSRQTSYTGERLYRRNTARSRPVFSPRRDSTTSAEDNHFETIRNNRIRPPTRQTDHWESDNESDPEVMVKNHSSVPYTNRIQFATTNYSLPQRRTRRAATLRQPRVSRRASMDISDDEAAETILQASPELPSDIAIHSILKRWGTQADLPESEAHETGMDETISGPLSRRSTYVTDGESHASDGVAVSFDTPGTNGST